MTDIFQILSNFTKANRKKVLKLAARLTAMHGLSIKTEATFSDVLNECNAEIYAEFERFSHGLHPKDTLWENTETALLHYFPDALKEVKQWELF